EKRNDNHEKWDRNTRSTRDTRFCASCASCVPFLLRSDVGHYFLGDKGFDLVTDFDVIKVLDTNTAFVSACDFRSIFLEALQGCDLTFEYHDIVSQQPDLRVAGDLAIRDIAAGNNTDLRNPEGIADFRRPQVRLLDNGFQHTLHGALDLIDHVVND